MPWFPLEVRNETGPTSSYRDTQITPHAQVFRLAFRFSKGGGGWIWNRPVAVTVRRGESPEQRLPIIDVTRLAQIAILALGIFGAMLIARRKSNE